MNDQTPSKHDQVLFHLVVNLQMMAMQQLGKLQHPVTGETGRDLEQARGTIDILEMLKTKCRTDTPEEILRILDQAVMDLQLNYLDEAKKGDTTGAGEDVADSPKAEEAGAEDMTETDGGEDACSD